MEVPSWVQTRGGRWAPRYEIKQRETTDLDITANKGGWALAQGELYYYALGNGYNVALDRSTDVGAPAVYITAAAEDEDFNERDVASLLKICVKDALSDDFLEWTDNMLRGWSNIFNNFNRPPKPPPTQNNNDDDW